MSGDATQKRPSESHEIPARLGAAKMERQMIDQYNLAGAVEELLAALDGINAAATAAVQLDRCAEVRQPMERKMTYYSSTISPDELAQFRRQWPAHGLPDDLVSLTFQFDGDGNLVDIEARSDCDRILDSAEFDGRALLALCEDAQRKVRPDHAERNPKCPYIGEAARFWHAGRRDALSELALNADTEWDID